MHDILDRQPKKTLLAITAVWACLAVTNAALIKLGVTTGSPVWFPISIFTGPTLHVTGIPFIALFALALAWTVRSADRLSGPHMALAGLVLIVLGNLGQGGIHEAFVRPFTDSGIQYYHDALPITSWREWLAAFTDHQAGYFDHTRTHPPFATLLHHLMLAVSGGSVLVLAGAFTLLSSVSVWLVWLILGTLDIPKPRRTLLATLFAVLPAVNIYSAVTLDGVVLTTATMFLLGLVIMLKNGRLTPTGLSLFGAGLILTNLLTFGGLFLIAVAGITALWELVARRRFAVAIAGLATLAAGGAILFALARFWGYDHLLCFRIASALENPTGFRALSEPLVYIFTRVEGVGEIALFLSLAGFAALMHPARLGLSRADLGRTGIRLLVTGVGVLAAMFLTGTYRTGETARCALYIYPYLLMAFTRADTRTLRDLVILAGAQTAAMQLFGGYFW